MDSSEALRRTMVTALRQIEGAENAAKQTGDAAVAQRQVALVAAKQKHAQLRQQADVALRETQTMMQEGDIALGELKLPAASAAPPPSLSMPATVDQAMRLLQNQRVAATEALNQLKSAAEVLKAERRKWWKFW